MESKKYLKCVAIVILFVSILMIIPHESCGANKKKPYYWQKQQTKLQRLIANENLNGHYLTFGSSILSSGYYGGLAGAGYEYRYHILAPNFAVGIGGLPGSLLSVNANAGVKLYLANKTRFLRNLYFNLLPVCYFGQYENHKTYYSFENNAVVKIDEFTYPHLYGMGLFFGYAPIWHLNQTVWLGFNVSIGAKTAYNKSSNKFEFNLEGYSKNQWRPINWDVGIVLKFEQPKKDDRFKKLYKTLKEQRCQ